MVHYLKFGNLDHFQRIVGTKRKRQTLAYCGRCHKLTSHPEKHASKHQEEDARLLPYCTSVHCAAFVEFTCAKCVEGYCLPCAAPHAAVHY
jgi:hypothetical protein